MALLSSCYVVLLFVVAVCSEFVRGITTVPLYRDGVAAAAPATAGAAGTDLDIADVAIELSASVPTATAVPEGGFRLRVKRADEGGKPLQLSLPSAATTVATLKALLAARTGIPASRQRLIHRGRLLYDGEMGAAPRHGSCASVQQGFCSAAQCC